MSSHANNTPKNPGFIPGSHRVKGKAVPRGEAIKNPGWTSKSKPIVTKGRPPSAKRGGSKKKTKKLRKTMRKRKGTKSKKTKRHHKRR